MEHKVKAPGAADQLGLVRAAGVVSAFTLFSRILGLVREQVFAALLGASLHADAFQIAFRIPNLLRDLFAEGALSAALVPTYAQTLRDSGRDGAFRVVNRLFTVLFVLLGTLVLLAVVFARPIVRTLAVGFDAVPGKTDETIVLTRIMLPFLPMVSFAAVAMGVLNAEARFSMPALAPTLFNAVAIVAGLGFWLAGLPPREAAIGWAVATLAGGAAQFLVQVPALRRGGFRFRPEWAPGDPGLRRIAALMVPATVGLAAVQINIFVSSYFASFEPRAVSWLQYAFRILYLPIGLFGVAVGTVAATGLAHRASEGDLEGLRETVRSSLRALGFLTIPATVGLVVLAEPVVGLLYERGAFTAQDTRATAAALACYSLGLVAYTGVKVLAPAFYALGSPRVPLVASGASVLTNLIVVVLTYRTIHHRGVALGVAAGAVVNVLVLAWFFQRRVGGLVGHGLIRGLAAMALAALPMAGVAYLAHSALSGWLPSSRLAGRGAVTLVPIVVGIAVYAAAAGLARLPELRSLLAAFGFAGQRKEM